MNHDPKAIERGARTAMARAVTSLLLVVGATACSSDNAPAPPTATLADCGGRAEAVASGMSKLSQGGYRFELTQLDPEVPVQSDGPPGNHWTITVTDPSGAPASDATLNILSFMPDHGHAGTPAAAVEAAPGVYDVSGLIFSMPTLFAVTLKLTLASGTAETVALMLCMDVPPS